MKKYSITRLQKCTEMILLIVFEIKSKIGVYKYSPYEYEIEEENDEQPQQQQ